MNPLNSAQVLANPFFTPWWELYAKRYDNLSEDNTILKKSLILFSGDSELDYADEAFF